MPEETKPEGQPKKEKPDYTWPMFARDFMSELPLLVVVTIAALVFGGPVLIAIADKTTCNLSPVCAEARYGGQQSE